MSEFIEEQPERLYGLSEFDLGLTREGLEIVLHSRVFDATRTERSGPFPFRRITVRSLTSSGT